MLTLGRGGVGGLGVEGSRQGGWGSLKREKNFVEE